MKKQIWTNLDHKIWQQKSTWPSLQRVLIALSGGVDSVVLLSVFAKLAPALNLELIVAHIHHGQGEQNSAWRDKAQAFCEGLVQSMGLKLVIGELPPQKLSNEEELRDFRYQELQRIKEKEKCEFILTAHHIDDLLETRFIRLLRGTGPLGLEALKEFSPESGLWRPFLKIQKEEIINYASENKLNYLEDPTNQNLDPMRNWLRHDLFPKMETRQKGITANLARSLQLIIDSLSPSTSMFQQSYHNILEQEGIGSKEVTSRGTHSNETDSSEIELTICKSLYFSLPLSEQRTQLAQALMKLGVKNYSQGQIKEIQKRLDNLKSVHTFTLASAHWRVDAKQIYVKLISTTPQMKRREGHA